MPGIVPLLVCAPPFFLWQELIRQLSVEWSFNPQYQFGWAVPALAAFLLARRLSVAVAAPVRNHRLLLGLLIVLDFLYLPTRFFMEANPDWRLVSWLLAMEVLGITWAYLGLFALSQKRGIPLAPFLFVLVSIPWPTLIEQPLVRILKSGTTFVACEVLGFMGIASVAQGNVIQLHAAALGLEDACSGIESLQAGLMVAMFGGEFYGLSVGGRIASGFLAVPIALLCNLLRTLCLALVLNGLGFPAFRAVHSMAGVVVSAIALGATFLIVRSLRHSQREAAMRLWPGIRELAESLNTRTCRSAVVAYSLCGWLAVTELAKEWWFSRSENALPAAVKWTAQTPVWKPAFRELPLTATNRRFLRFDAGFNVLWEEPEARWQLVYLQWNSGRSAAHLAANHTPVDCLAAAGIQLAESPSFLTISANGLQLPFTCLVGATEEGPLRVYYCLWPDRGCPLYSLPGYPTYRKRLQAVLSGRRNSGQRSLEIAVWGMPSSELCETLVQQLLNEILRKCDSSS